MAKHDLTSFIWIVAPFLHNSGQGTVTCGWQWRPVNFNFKLFSVGISGTSYQPEGWVARTTYTYPQ